MIDIDHEKFETMPLDVDAFEVACDRATEAHVAGLDPHDQLEHGIKGYLLALEAMGCVILSPGTVPLPKTDAEAAAMLAIARSYTKGRDS